MEPIGVIKTPYQQKLGIPRQGALAQNVRGTIHLDRKRVGTGALNGLEGFSHLWLIFDFHLSDPIKKSKIHAPRLEGESIGVLASRSPHRPNPLGLSLCRLLAVDHQSLQITVEGVDLINETPILDVKPYVGYCDRPDSWQEGWTQKCKPTRNEVVFSEQAVHEIQQLNIPTPTLEVVKESLAYDPRPYSQKSSKENFATIVDGWHFHFRVEDDQTVVFKVANDF